MKWGFIFFIIVHAVFLEAVAGDAPKIIAFAQGAMSNDFRKAQVFSVRDHLAHQPNLIFTYSNTQGQTSLLIKQIEQFSQQSIDLLIVGTNDENAVVPIVSKTYQSGIPVIVLDRGINSSDYTTFINADNVEIGSIF